MAALLNIDSRRAFAGRANHRAPLVLAHARSTPPGRLPAPVALVRRWTPGTSSRLVATWIPGAPDRLKLPDD